MNEIATVNRIRRRVPSLAGSGVLTGIGDDCAIFRPQRRGQDYLFTTDMLIEDVHFRRATHPASSLGHRALARGLSDIAAMGGEPRFCLLSLALAPWTDQRWIDGFFRGFLALALKTRTLLAGGDLARSGKVVCDVAVCGSVPAGKALRRSGARVGDRIYVSGRLGASALGLEKGRGRAWKQHLRPQPRLELGRFLRERLRATAAMDLSDGLSLDLHRLCLASGVAASLQDRLPVFRGATLDHALHGGEDYELLFTLGARAKPPREFGGVPLTSIGEIRAGKPGSIDFAGLPLEPLGYDHFRGR